MLCKFILRDKVIFCPDCGLTAPSIHSKAMCRPERKALFKPKGEEHGPGTELKKLLSIVGIKATGGCSCTSRAAKMDAMGCDWCELNIDEIVGWLREEATKRRLPFIDVAGRILVRRAIANARRKATG